MATFTPSIVLDPNTGEEIVSYDQGIYDSGEGRNAAIAHHMQSHQAQYVTDANGRVHHETYHRWIEGVDIAVLAASLKGF